MRAAVFVLCLFLAACGRPLTPAETEFVTALAGDTLDPRPIRVIDGHVAGSLRLTMPVRPRVTCQERLWPPVPRASTVTVSPAATVLFNRIYLRSDLYRDDMLAGFPKRIALADAMLLAHEAVHVWQWQNRARTGYHPLRALAEHGAADPYRFDPDTAAQRFLDYGYEQQGAIVEEYVCCRLLDPDAPRTQRLRDLIGQALPVARLDGLIDAPEIAVPWSGVQSKGICRATS